MTALNVEAPGEVGTGRAQEERKANDVNFAGYAGDKQPDWRKIKATLTAQLALRGFALKELADASFVASRWHLQRPLPDLRAVRAFAAQVGAV